MRIYLRPSNPAADPGLRRGFVRKSGMEVSHRGRPRGKASEQVPQKLAIYCKLYYSDVIWKKPDILSTWAVFSERCCRPSVCRPSVVCNVRAPYSGGSNFRQYFYDIRYLGHPLTSTENFTEIVPAKPLRRGRSTQEG